MKSPRAIWIALGILVAVAFVGWFSISQSSNNSSSSSPAMTSGMRQGTSTDQRMSGMDAGGGESGQATSGMSMSDSGSMHGMRPLVSGADGTKPSAGGLTLQPERTTLGAGDLTRWQLRVTDRSGSVVTRFERDQTKLMHLIVVRSDLSGYQHLHPTLGRGGVFTIQMRLPTPGIYRAIADFTTGGKRYALGVQITVPGRPTLIRLPAPSMSTETDGYSVMAMHGMLKAAAEAHMSFSVERNGQPMTGLLPYLGAYGHLVALRQPTLAYSHVHPTSQDRGKGTIGFSAEFPRAGTYRLFLQFRTASGVHTAAFTVTVI